MRMVRYGEPRAPLDGVERAGDPYHLPYVPCATPPASMMTDGANAIVSQVETPRGWLPEGGPLCCEQEFDVGPG